MRLDCHIHMVLSGSDWKAAIARHRARPDDDAIRSVLAAYQDAGFTYLRDGGDKWGTGKRARELAPEYGITYRTPLAPLSKRGHYGGFIGLQFETMDEFAGLVRKQKAEGADFVKIMISGLMDFDTFDRLTEPGLSADEIRQMIAIAHGENLSVMAHTNGNDTVLAAAEAGVDSVEHGAYLNMDALHAMQEAGTVWVPTLSAIGNLRGTGRFDEKAVEAIYESACENVRRFSSLGGLLAPGSDAGAYAVLHGQMHEYEHLRHALGANAENALSAGIQAILQKF